MTKNCTLHVESTPSNLSKETGLAPRFQGPSLPAGEGVTPWQAQNFRKSGGPQGEKKSPQSTDNAGRENFFHLIFYHQYRTVNCCGF